VLRAEINSKIACLPLRRARGCPPVSVFTDRGMTSSFVPRPLWNKTPLELVGEINRLLEKKERRQITPSTSSSSSAQRVTTKRLRSQAV
jgi:hypothetical protein